MVFRSKYYHSYIMLMLVAVCIISRLPQLLSPYMILDEDECLLGLMAKHLVDGKEVSVFFWGQTYGFSLLESGLSALYYLLFGYSDISIKMAMLSIFLAGVLFFYKALCNLTINKWLPLAITLILVLSPAWAVWSMKARGGYLTTFLLSSIFTWLLFKPVKHIIATYCTLGALLALIFYSQPLWLPGLLPLLLYKIISDRPFTKCFNLLAGMIPIILLFESVKRTTYHMWAPKVFELKPHFINAATLLFDHLHAYYYLDNVYAAPFICKLFAWSFILLIALLLVTAMYKAVNSFRRDSLYIASVFSVSATLAYTLFLTDHSPRYFLPITGCCLLSLCILLNNQPQTRQLAIPAVFVVIGCMTTVSFKDYHFSAYSKKQLLACMQYLQQHQLSYIFCNDVPQQWQLAFYSREQLTCRQSYNVDRYPLYIQQVNNAYYYSPLRTAAVDVTGDLKDMAPDSTVTVDSFFIVPHPSKSLLKDMEVEF